MPRLYPFEFEYRPAAPYLFTPHLQRFTLEGRPTPWLYDPARRLAWRLLALGRERVGVNILFEGEPWSPVSRVRVLAPSRAAALDGFQALLHILRVDFNYNEFLRRVESVDPLYRLALRHPGLRPGRCLSLYNALIDAIVKQRIALRLALRIQSRLVEAYSPRLEHGGRVYFDYPSPGALASAGVEELMGHGLTRLKAEALVEAARAELEGRLPTARETEEDPEGVVRELQALRGVGPWTAELAVAMVLGRLAVGPRTDLAVRRGLERLLGPAAREAVKALGDMAGLAMYLAAYEYETVKRGGRGRAPRVRRRLRGPGGYMRDTH